MENDTKNKEFYFGEEVIVVKGFFTGQKGRIYGRRKNLWGQIEYDVDLYNVMHLAVSTADRLALTPLAKTAREELKQLIAKGGDDHGMPEERA